MSTVDHEMMSSSRIVLMQDIVKLFVSLLTLVVERGLRGGLTLIFSQRKMALAYLAPATLYAAYNILTITGLSLFSPSTYFVLLQFRIVVVGLLSVVVLRKRISLGQWIGLLVVMFGTMVGEGRGVDLSSSSAYGYLVIGAQLILSGSASVLNEYFLKLKSGGDMNSQNFFMYIDSIFVSSILSLWGVMDKGKMVSRNPTAWIPIVISGSATGIITSYFLSRLDSVWKSIASAIEIWVTVVFSYVFFGYQVGIRDVIGFTTVSMGAVMYTSLGKSVMSIKKSE
jgi:drug/metabolite transporter (DMT)-like permease